MPQSVVIYQEKITRSLGDYLTQWITGAANLPEMPSAELNSYRWQLTMKDSRERNHEL